MLNSDTYEVVIIGGSYAGMSAAMALGRSRRKVLIIDAGEPCNKTTPHSHNFLTQDGSPPSEISSIAKSQVLSYPTVHWHQGKALDVLREKELFKVDIEAGKTVLGRKIIIATGLKDTLPQIPGFKECWGKTIIHCPYCHGYEFSNQTTGIFTMAEQALEMVKLIGNWTNDLKLFLNDGELLLEEHKNLILNKKVEIISQPVVEVVHDKGVLKHLIMADNSNEPLTALYARLPTTQASFLTTFGCSTTASGHIEIDMFGKTSVQGVYAAGDCTHPMRSVATAVYTGNIAGAMLNHELIEENF